jgi:hypothetical protein
MAINFRCGRCDKLLQAADDAVGRIVACPGCAAQLPVPGVVPARAAVPTVPVARPAAARPAAAASAPQPLPQPLPQPQEFFEPPPLVIGYEPTAGRTRKRQRKPLDKRVVFAIAGGGVLLIAVVVGAVIMLGGGRGSSGSRSVARAVHYLPDDADMVFSVNMSSITKSKLWQKFEQQAAMKRVLDKLRAETNMTPADIVHFTGGGSMSSKMPVVVLETHKKIDRKSIFKGAGGDGSYKEEKIAGKTVYVSNSGGEAAYMPDDTTLVVGPRQSLQSVLERKGDLPAKVKSLADQLKPSAGFSMAMKPPEQAGGMPGANDLAKGVQSIAVHADIGSDVRVSASLACKDSETAKKMKETYDQQVAQLIKDPSAPPPVREMLQKTKVSQSGSQLNTEVTISEAMIEQIVALASLMGGPAMSGG